MKALTDKFFLLPERKFLLIIFLGALCLRLAVGFIFGNIHHPQMYEHGDIAHNLLHGYGYSFHWPYSSFDGARQAIMAAPPEFEGAFIPPLNPYLIYLVFLGFGEGPLSTAVLIIFNALCSALSVWLVYRVSRLFLGEQVSRLSAVAATIYFPTIAAVTTFSGSAQYQLLALAIMFFSIRAVKYARSRDFLYSGILSGLLTLARSEYLIPAFLIIAATAFFAMRIHGGKGFARNLILPGLICALIIAPWTYRNYRLYDKFVPVVTHPWHEIWKGYNPIATGGMQNTLGTGMWLVKENFPVLTQRLDSIPYNVKFEINADAVFRDEAQTFMKNNPGQSLFLTVKKAVMLWTLDYPYPNARHPLYVLFTLIVIPPLLFGYYRFFRRRKNQLDTAVFTLYGIFLLYYTAMFAVTVALPRYQIYIVTVALPFAGIGWAFLLEKVLKRDIPAGSEEPELMPSIQQ